jgi:ABC-type uncharacterized transport system auxiliary subunit
MRRRLAALILLAGLMGGSCGSVPKTYFYTLRVPPAPASGDPKTGFVLGVERFRAVEMLRDDRIIYYKSPTELDYYAYHRWSEDPATMVTEMTARWLDQTGIFAEVKVLPRRESVDYTLSGRLFSFEEVDYEAGGKGRVALRLTLTRSRDRQVVWTLMRQTDRAIEEKGMAGVVDALDAATADLLREAVPGLAAQVERDFKETQQHSQ